MCCSTSETETARRLIKRFVRQRKRPVRHCEIKDMILRDLPSFADHYGWSIYSLYLSGDLKRRKRGLYTA